MSYQAGIQSLENRSPIPFLVKGRLFQQPLIHGYSFISIGSQMFSGANTSFFKEFLDDITCQEIEKCQKF